MATRSLSMYPAAIQYRLIECMPAMRAPCAICIPCNTPNAPRLNAGKAPRSAMPRDAFAPITAFLKPAATSHAVCKSEFMLVMHCPRGHRYQQNIPQRHAAGCFCAHLSLFLMPAATSHAVCKSEFMLAMHCPRGHPYQQNIPQRHATGCSCANLMPLFKSVAPIYAHCRSAIVPGIRSPHRA